MRILFMGGGGFIYGKEIITLSLMEGLRKRGHEVRCITTIWGSAFAGRLDTLKIPYVRLPLGFISKTLRWDCLWMTLNQLVRLPQLWWGYWRTVKEFDPDFIFHSNFHFLLLLWPLLDPQKTFFHVHDYFKSKSLYRSLIRFLGRRLRAFIGVSNFIRDSIIGLGIPEDRVFSVLNGIEVIESNGIKRTDPQVVTVGIVGQVAEWKGHDDLVEALRILKDRKVFPRCIIFGEGDPRYIAMLKQRVTRYGVDEQVSWAGYVQNKKNIFGKIDICVVPSQSQESFSTVACEAASLGIPVIATRRGGFPEIIQEGKTGYLVDQGSPQQIAKKLEHIIKEPDLRQRMGQAAKFYALQNLTQSRMVQEMETLLLHLCPKRL